MQDRAGVGYQPQHHHCDREKGQRDVRRDGGEEEWGRMGERREGEEGKGGGGGRERKGKEEEEGLWRVRGRREDGGCQEL